ncbi:GpE family phage tail protein [Polaromonas sp. JS666]
MAEVAFTFHWSNRELMAMDIDELMEWHQQVSRINKHLNK